MTTYGIVATLLLAQAGQATQSAPQAPLIAAAPNLTLEDALREAQAKNLDLKVARARLDQSKELHWKAWSAYLPQISATGTYTHNELGDVNVPFPVFSDTGAFQRNASVLMQKQEQVNGQVQASQAIVAPQAWFAIAAARAGERLGEDSTESARRDILFGVAQAYYGAVGLRQVVTIQERQLTIALDHEKDAKVRFDAGTTPKVTLLRAEIDRSRAEQDLKRAQNSHLSAKVALATLLDRKDAEFDVVVPASPRLPSLGPEALEEAAARDRPDVKAAAEQVTVSSRNRAGVVTRYLPTLGAFGRYQYSNAAGFSGDTTTWAVGLALNWTILDGFLRESDLRESAGKVREAEAARASTIVKARADVRQARLDLDSAVANREKAKEQLALAQENQRLVNVNYKAGAATYLEVTDANTALLQAELTQVSESLSADLAALRVLKAAGAFDPTQSGGLNPAVPQPTR